MRILYRLRQFWHTLSVNTNSHQIEQARALLTPAQWKLFERLQASEKHHALEMLHSLLEQGENQPELLMAALLHDVGKLRYPLNPIERAWAVLVGAVLPQKVHHWGNLAPNDWGHIPRWRKAFVVAEQHACWGAELAREAKVSPLTETLIRYHHQPQLASEGNVESHLLHKLWLVDNES